MNSSDWFLALPTYFLMGPEGLLGHIILVLSLVFVAVKRPPGFTSYVLFAIAPVMIQIIMLVVIGLLGRHSDNIVVYTAMFVAEMISLYMIYQSLKHPSRKIIKGLVAFSQLYAIARGSFIGLMSASGSWL